MSIMHVTESLNFILISRNTLSMENAPYWSHIISVPFFVRPALSISRPSPICAGADYSTGS